MTHYLEYIAIGYLIMTFIISFDDILLWSNFILISTPNAYTILNQSFRI